MKKNRNRLHASITALAGMLILCLTLVFAATPSYAKSQEEEGKDIIFLASHAGDGLGARARAQHMVRQNPREPLSHLVNGEVELWNGNPHRSASSFAFIVNELKAGSYRGRIGKDCNEIALQLLANRDDWDAQKGALDLAEQYGGLDRAKAVEAVLNRARTKLQKDWHQVKEAEDLYAWAEAHGAGQAHYQEVYEAWFRIGLAESGENKLAAFARTQKYGNQRGEEIAKAIIAEAERSFKVDPYVATELTKQRKQEYMDNAKKYVTSVRYNTLVKGWPADVIVVTPENSSKEKPYRLPDVPPGGESAWVMFDCEKFPVKNYLNFWYFKAPENGFIELLVDNGSTYLFDDDFMYPYELTCSPFRIHSNGATLESIALYVSKMKAARDGMVGNFDNLIGYFRGQEKQYMSKKTKESLFNYIRYPMWLGKYDEAYSIMKEFIASNPKYADDSAILTYMGLCLIKGSRDHDTQKNRKGAELVEKGLSKNANDYLLNYAAWGCAVAGENLDEAELIIKRSNKLNSNAGYTDSLGYIYYRQKKYKEAVAEFERAVSMGPNQPSIEILEHLGDAYIKVGDTENAKLIYKKIVSLDLDSIPTGRAAIKLKLLASQ